MLNNYRKNKGRELDNLKIKLTFINKFRNKKVFNMVIHFVLLKYQTNFTNRKFLNMKKFRRNYLFIDSKQYISRSSKHLFSENQNQSQVKHDNDGLLDHSTSNKDENIDEPHINLNLKQQIEMFKEFSKKICDQIFYFVISQYVIKK
ncbi:hypothetical protein BpHYR1_035559 [Brachionus plicatilis]|uniref:Uncharacterized protein n=1 Tax=Brachionus plicatilis TaxID=10195 RepID=A0A3M7PPR9_BRAPC|nr:hypothetical protein BpHYR1_035559 [Brachionus plicatilis]